MALTELLYHMTTSIVSLLLLASCPLPLSRQWQPDAGTQVLSLNAEAEAEGHVATGTVRNAKGEPLAGAEVWAATGMGSLFSHGPAITDKNGKYRLEFSPRLNSEAPNFQMANITARLPGHAEKNLNRHGLGHMASRELTQEELTQLGAEAKTVALPGKPREVDFVMVAADSMEGILRNEAGKRLNDCRVWLTGDDMPPGASAVCVTKTDAIGRFKMENVPRGFTWQIQCELPATENSVPSEVLTSRDFDGELTETGSVALWSGESRKARVQVKSKGIEVPVVHAPRQTAEGWGPNKKTKRFSRTLNNITESSTSPADNKLTLPRLDLLTKD